MPILNHDVLEKFILVPDIAQFHLDEEKGKLLQSAIRKIKIKQLENLAADIKATLSDFATNEDPEKMKSALRITLFANLDLGNKATFDALLKVFNLSLLNKEKDEQLYEQLKAIDGLNFYDTAYELRHMYYLDKEKSARENPNAFPETISERKRGDGHKHVCKFLYVENSNFLTTEEKEILSSIYNVQELQKNKVARRKAHENITLQPCEIQGLIAGVAQVVLETGKVPEINFTPIIFSEKTENTALALNTLKVFASYTNILYKNFAREQSFQKLKELFTRNPAGVNSRNFHSGMCFLSYAIINKQKEIVQLLLNNHVNINNPDRMGYSPLHYAVELQSPEILNMLLAKKCNVNCEDRGHYTPIYVAAELGHAEHVQALLDHGADPNLANNRYQSSALHIAVRQCRLEVVEVLLKSKKAFTDLLDLKQSTPLQLARGLNEKIAALLEQNPQPSNHINKMPPKKIPNLQINMANLNPQQVKGVNTVLQSTQLTAAQKAKIFLQHGLVPPQQPLLSPAQQNTLNPTEFAKLLQDPKENKRALQNLASTLTRAKSFTLLSGSQNFLQGNFYPLYQQYNKMEPEEVKEKQAVLQGQSLHTVYKRYLELEVTALTEKQSLFEKLIKEIENFDINEAKLTYPQRYYRISKIIDTLLGANYSIIAISAKLIALNYLEVLINLFEGKSPMHLAIDSEDIGALKDILLDHPNREKEIIVYKQKSLSEIEYAIQVGQVNIVKALIEMAQTNALVKLGVIPQDAISQAETKREEISAINPAHKETEKYFDISIEKASEKNLKQLLRNLMETLPDATDAVHGLFTPAEYKIVQMLIADKEKKSSFYLYRFKKMQQYFSSLLYNGNEQEKLFSQDVLPAINKIDLEQLKSKHESLRIKPDAPRLKSIYKHATSNYSEIEKNGELVTVQHALSNGLVRFVSTPEGTRSNIFFSQNSELNETTPFLATKATHIFKVDIAKMIKAKALKQKDVYRSLHIPFLKLERVEQTQIFYSDDKQSKTIYSIYHCREKNVYKKVHWFDYYENNKWIGSSDEVHNMEDEFVMGDNIKSLAWELIWLLRKIKGPLANSYTDYVLKNAGNPHVVDSARAALFNVLNVEGKITKGISIKHEAVTVVENEEAKAAVPLNKDVHTILNHFIKENNPDEFKDFINTNGINKHQLVSFLLEAINNNCTEIVSLLLDKGVPTSFENNQPLRHAIATLQSIYLTNNRNTEHLKFQESLKIVEMLLGYGYADKNDPDHIRHGSPIDSYGAPPLTPQWGNLSEVNLANLKGFLSVFDEFEIQRLCLDHVCRFLPELYEFTFSQGMTKAHEYIANRLHKESKYLDKEICVYLDMIKNKDIGGLEKYLGAMLQPELDKAYYVLSHAILGGDEKVISACYTFFKNFIQNQSDEKVNFNPLILAIKTGQISVAKLLIELGINFNKKGLGNYSGLDAAGFYKLTEVETLILEKTSDPQVALQMSVKAGNVDLVKSLLKRVRLEFPGFVFNANGEKEVKPYLMYEAMVKGNEEIVALLLTAYLEIGLAADKMSDLKKIVYRWCIYSIKLDKFGIFNLLFKEISTRDKLFSTLFCTREFGLLYSVVEFGTPDFLSKTIDLVDKLSSSKKEKIYNFEYNLERSTGGGVNYLHKALECNKLDNLKVLGRIKTLSFKSDYTPDDIDLLSFAIQYCCDSRSAMEALIHDYGVKIPDDINDKTKILLCAIFAGDIEFIKHLFAKNYFNKDDVSKDNKNYLQLMYDQLSQTVVKKVHNSFSKVKEAITLLCDEIGVDVNHKDSNDKCVLHYSFDQGSYIDAFQEALVLCNTIDLTLPGKKIGPLLLDVPLGFITPEILDNFIKRGGDINVLKEDGYTLRESYAILQADRGDHYFDKSKNNWVKLKCGPKFIELGGKARRFAPGIDAHFGIATVTVNNQMYTLLCNGQLIIYALREDEGYPLGPLHHYHRGNPKKLPTAKDMIGGALGGNVEWIKMPTKFITNDKGTFAKVDTKTYPISELFMLMAQIITAKHKDVAELDSNEKDKSKVIYSLTDDELKQLTHLLKTETDRLKELYVTLLTEGDNNNLEHMGKILEHFRNKNLTLPFHAYVFLSRQDTYKSVLFHSPLAAAVVSRDKDKVSFLLKEGFSDSETGDMSLTGIAYAIKTFNVEILTLLLGHQKVSAESVLKCLRILLWSLGEKNNYTEELVVLVFKTLIDYALNFKSSAKFKNSMAKFATDIQYLKDSLAPARFKEIEEQFETFKSTGTKRGHKKEEKDQEPAPKKSKAVEFIQPSLIVGTQPPLITNNPVTFFGKRPKDNDNDDGEQKLNVKRDRKR